MNRVLIIARVFPPFQSVGHSIRVVKFLKYLPTLGWLPSVLTVDERKEYESDRRQGSETLLVDIPPEVTVHRTRAGEPSWSYLQREQEFGRRNLLTRVIAKLIGGTRRWIFRNFLIPDRGLLWLPFAVHRGRRIAREQEIDVIFATCPPFSASLIGAVLKVVTGKRLILDFRDDWLDTPAYEVRPAIGRMISRTMERLVVKVADKVILVTQWSRDAFLKRYPKQANDKFVLIPNGCDLEEFAVLYSTDGTPPTSRFTMVHAGTLTDAKHFARSTAPLFQALHSLLKRETRLVEDLELVFTGFLPAGQRSLVGQLGLSSIVKELGFLPRAEFLRLMHDSDLLVVINYEGYPTLIPGKLYEYWAVGGPPILLLSCPGAAASLVEHHNLGSTVEPSDVVGIEDTILRGYRQKQLGLPIRIKTAGIERYDRKALTVQLAEILSGVSQSEFQASHGQPSQGSRRN